MVATNQARKDWGTAFAAMARVKNVLPAVRFWVHTDEMDRSHGWSIPALIDDFGLWATVTVTDSSRFDSEQLSYMYSACDLTILPSMGEGFGSPIIESLACGVPVLHTNYAAGPQQIPNRNWLVEIDGERLEGLHNLVRPLLNPVKWADAITRTLEETGGGVWADECVRSVEHLKWKNLWPGAWRKWFLKGIGQ
jgi:glycosyltransferase involved in cell wall biosynthesis